MIKLTDLYTYVINLSEYHIEAVSSIKYSSEAEMYLA